MTSVAVGKRVLMTSLQEFQSGAFLSPRPNQSAVHVDNSPHQTTTKKPFDPTGIVERSSVLYHIDRVFSNIKFDFSCLDTLDDELFQHPIDSFVDICWMDAVEDEPYIEPSLQFSDASSSDDDGQTFSTSTDDTPTVSSDAQWHEGFMNPNLPQPQVFVLPLTIDSESPSIRFNVPDDDKKSFMLMDPPLFKFPVLDPNHSIHFFPTANRQNFPSKPTPNNPFSKIYNRLPGLVRWNS
jgi:hypothetical protein